MENSENPWTPGPWQVIDWDEATTGIGPDPNAPIAYLDETATDDARLIAAAPEMAELLDDINRWGLTATYGAHGPGGTLSRLNSLLARIRGES